MIRRALSLLGAAGVMALVASGCGSNSTDHVSAVDTPRTTQHVTDTSATLHAAAIAWAHAFLTGTPADITAREGPECAATDTSSTFDTRFIANYLQATRTELAQHLGRPLDNIKIRNVLTRNLTTTTGEAEVVYDLPETVAGNDNWVTYALHNGQWLVADCHAPIGGSSSSASGTITAPTTANSATSAPSTPG